MRKFKHYRDCRTLGDRVVYWRQEAKMSRSELAKLIHMPYSSLSEIENNGQHSSTKITELATALRVNAHYLASGQGDPRDITAVPAPRDVVGELARMVTVEDLARLTQTEFELAQFRVRQVVEDILKTRKPSKSASNG